MDNPIVTLAETANAWRTTPLPQDVAWAARRVVLDWFATTLPGCGELPARLLAEALSDEPEGGGAVCYVDGRFRAPRHAALLNATASHIVEFDDIFKDGGYHPGSPTIAAALALAQARGRTLEQFHRALIAGYEVGCRVSLAIQPSHYDHWHTTATVGAIGAAVAGAVLLDCDAGRIAHAIALATSFAAGHQQNLQGAGMAKALHAGHAAEAGLLAALAASRGVTGSLDSLHAANGFAAATSASTGDWDAAFQGLGDWTPITRMTVKNHGCCGHIFPALDGLRIMRRDHGFGPEDIARIQVNGYAATRRMCDRPAARTAQEARFSLQYCVAADLLLGGVRLNAFTDAALGRADIRRLMTLVSVGEEADIVAAYPKRRMADLVVELTDGRTLRHRQTTRKGDPEDPLSDAELVAKYDELAATALPPAMADELKERILRGDRLPGPIVGGSTDKWLG